MYTLHVGMSLLYVVGQTSFCAREERTKAATCF